MSRRSCRAIASASSRAASPTRESRSGAMSPWSAVASPAGPSMPRAAKIRASRASTPAATRRSRAAPSKDRSTISAIGADRLGLAQPLQQRRTPEACEERSCAARQHETHGTESLYRGIELGKPIGFETPGRREPRLDIEPLERALERADHGKD